MQNLKMQSKFSRNSSDFEILIIYDDNNTEDLLLIKELKEKDNRIKLITNK